MVVAGSSSQPALLDRDGRDEVGVISGTVLRVYSGGAPIPDQLSLLRTITGLPARRGSRTCSTEAKKASMSRWRTYMFGDVLCLIPLMR